MSTQPPQQPSQGLNISGSVLEGVQIGGIAGRDMNLTQIQGGVHVTNVFGAVQVDREYTQVGQPQSQQEYRWRQVLLDKVKRFWIDGVLAKSLHTKLFIELGLEDRNDFIENPLSKVQEFPTDSGQTFQTGTTATDIFEDIGAGRTLLILGEPGSGKTVTLLKLAESLIAQAAENLSQPLPVVMNLSSWAKQRKTMAEWLVQELHEIYGASKSLGKTWVAQEQLILLLDGLDEVEPQYRNDCVKALNQFIQEHGLTEMVVCSRIQDYESLTERLKLRSAIFVQPLTSQQIDQTLEQAGDSLSALRIALQKNDELRAFASSPLILSIMSLAYQGSTIEALNQTGTPEAQHKQLFDAYIDRMFTRRGTTRKYSRAQTLYWLTWLAQQMVRASQSVFLIERLQPSWLISRRQRVRYRIISALTFGLIFGLIIGLASGLQGAINVLGSGLLYGVAGGLVVGFGGNIEPVETLKWSWPEARKNLRKWLIIMATLGLMFGVPIGFIAGLIEDLGLELRYELLAQLLEGLFGGVVSGLFFGLMGGLLGSIAGLISGFRGPAIQTSNGVNQGIWKSVRNALLAGLSAGLIFGLIAGLIAGIFGGLVNSLKYGLIYALGTGLVGGVIFGGSACFRHFILRLLLYRQSNSPWNYARFLDYAADRLFMQKVGGGYIFVHRMLMEHFAQMKLESESKAT
ncbi:NACHT domain-containing protein [Leptolyngbyaceae cyanobacterium CCMR0082]|uniref:NACHT domain-containing protein n=1 Tax=Adonisia turfae CCMR0082 TaxID=2304604 RepID=A0A6M0S4K5_9CYAN|nr:NACHT domain-containing protein [Adonisia turfae]NEZ62993.1 NACHT domain-containing protein [Adonisia turfae CCMR0082]